MKTITPPKTLDELPERLFQAWRDLGCELKDNDLSEFEEAWADNKSFGTQTAHALCRKSVPVRQFPGWADAIIDIINSTPTDEVKRRSRQLVSSLNCFLDGASLYQLRGLTDELIRPYSILGAIPRDTIELQDLASIIPSLDGADVQRHAIRQIASSIHSSKAVPIPQRDKALLDLLPQLAADTLHFPYNPEHDYSYHGSDAAHYFCEGLEDPDLLVELLKRGNSNLRLEVFDRINSLAYKIVYKEKQRSQISIDDLFNSKMLSLITEYVDEFVTVRPWVNQNISAALWASNSITARDFALAGTIQLFGDEQDSQESALDSIKAMLTESPDVAGENTTEQLGSSELKELDLLWKLNLKTLQLSILKAMASKIKSYGDEGDYVRTWEDDETATADRAKLSEIIRAGLVSQSVNLKDFKPADLSTLIPYINSDEMAVIVLPGIQVVAAKSKPLRTALGPVLQSISPKLFADWLTDKRKGVREVALEGLIKNNSPESLKLLRNLHLDKKINDADKDRIASRLLELGDTNVTQPRNELTVENIIEKAFGTKIKPQVNKLWSSELAEVFEPFDEHTALWLLTMSFESKDEKLPSTVIAALELLPRDQQARISEQLVLLWITNNGDSKHRWLTKFVPTFADDRVVDPLMKSFQGWFKRAKPKSVFVLETLGKLDTTYALSQVMTIYGKNIYSYALQKGAGDTLRAAAERRKVEMIDLFDELTPDFGLGHSGLVLDVGDFNYVVNVASDLSLSVRNEQTGKVTKTFPKVKKSNDVNLHSGAESQFKLLRSNLKKVAKQQGKRLFEAMVSERSWSLPRWQILFEKHPLLRLIGQSMIWETAEGESFRMSEDLSLISNRDDLVELTEADQIRFWHPTNSSIEDVAAWKQHLEDYSIKPMFDQIGQPKVEFSKEELSGNSLERFSGLKVEGQTVSQYMKSWNYDQHDGDGSWIASYICRFRLAGIAVVLELDDMSMFPLDGFPTTIQRFEFYRDGDLITLNEVPRSLVATIIGQGETLKSQS